MKVRFLWNGREITGDEPEYQAHFRELIIRDFLPYARAHPEGSGEVPVPMPIKGEPGEEAG